MPTGLAHPNHASGYARERSESAYPELWNRLAFGWAPSLGFTGLTTIRGAIPWTPNITLGNVASWAVADPPPAGPGNTAPVFNGTTSDGTTDLALDLTDTSVLTISLWLYWDAFANNDDLAFESSANFNTNAGAIIFNPNSSSPSGVAVLGCKVTAVAGEYNTYSFARPSAAVWHHYLFCCDRDAGVQQWTAAYVDGASQALTLVDNDTASGTFGSFTWFFMSRNAGSLFGAGRLGDFFIWKNLLGQREAMALAQGASPLTLKPRLVAKAAAVAPPAGNRRRRFLIAAGR